MAKRLSKKTLTDADKKGIVRDLRYTPLVDVYGAHGIDEKQLHAAMRADAKFRANVAVARLRAGSEHSQDRRRPSTAAFKCLLEQFHLVALRRHA